MAEESFPDDSTHGTPPGEADPTGSDRGVDLDALMDAAGVEPADGDHSIERLVAEAHDRGLLDTEMRELRTKDAAQAFVGSVIFASPLLVEGGIYDIADFLFGFTVAGVPVFLVANTLFVLVMTYALLEWTGRNTEETDVLFGVIPVRYLMVLGVSFAVAAVMMTVWGRVGTWQSPTEALARINVVWTVGSLGAALGDIIADSDPPSPPPEAGAMFVAGARDHPGGTPVAGRGDNREGSDSSDRSPSPEGLTDVELLTRLHERFDDLESSVDTVEAGREVQRIREKTVESTLDATFGDRIQKYTSRDIAEAFVGSIFFSVPFLVEDGVFDVADYFLSFQVGVFPVFFVVNTAFVLVMILLLVYWAGPQDVQMSRPILGFVPRRLVGISVVSFLTAAALMTMWGRVDAWEDPVVAVARVSVVWTVASFGAALGDILPGESSGDDINDDLAALGDFDEESASGDRVDDR